MGTTPTIPHEEDLEKALGEFIDPSSPSGSNGSWASKDTALNSQPNTEEPIEDDCSENRSGKSEAH